MTMNISDDDIKNMVAVMRSIANTSNLNATDRAFCSNCADMLQTMKRQRKQERDHFTKIIGLQIGKMWAEKIASEVINAMKETE